MDNGLRARCILKTSLVCRWHKHFSKYWPCRKPAVCGRHWRRIVCTYSASQVQLAKVSSMPIPMHNLCTSNRPSLYQPCLNFLPTNFAFTYHWHTHEDMVSLQLVRGVCYFKRSCGQPAGERAGREDPAMGINSSSVSWLELGEVAWHRE